PAARTCCSDSRPTATPSPGGKPWATSVVSSATTADHSRTSSETQINPPPHGGSCRPLHLDEPASPVVLGDLTEAGSPVGTQRPLVPPCEPEPEPLRLPLQP